MNTIKYNKCGNDFSIALISNLEKMIAGEIDGIKIENIPSAAFCEIVECEPNDFNGWQCDWWGSFQYHNRTFNVSGCAWYGTINIGLE